MENIKKINVYVGEVGSAYADTEYAYKRYQAALKNIDDMIEIKDTATTIKDEDLESTLTSAQEAYTRSANILAQLENLRNDTSLDDIKRRKIENLFNEYDANDHDRNPYNGGSVITATGVIEDLNEQSIELLSIIEEAAGYLDDTLDENGIAIGRLIRIANQYEKEWQIKKKIWEDMLIPEEIDELGLSDEIERELWRRIGLVTDAINDAKIKINAINTVSDDTESALSKIVYSVKVTINVVGGTYSNSETQTVLVGSFATWEISAEDGYHIDSDTEVTNGTIEGNVVKSNVVDESSQDFTVTVVCKQNENTDQNFNVTLNVTNGTIYVENEENIVSKTLTVSYGGSASFIIVPDEGYVLPPAINGASIETNNIVTVNNVYNDITINVTCVDNQNQTQYYYWYVGNANDPMPTEISPIVTDNVTSGWRLIGSSLESGYQLWDETYEIQIASTRVNHRIIINSDNVNIAFFDSLGNRINFVNEPEVINGWTVYTTRSTSKTFGIITKIQ